MCWHACQRTRTIRLKTYCRTAGNHYSHSANTVKVYWPRAYDAGLRKANQVTCHHLTGHQWGHSKPVTTKSFWAIPAINQRALGIKLNPGKSSFDTLGFKDNWKGLEFPRCLCEIHCQGIVSSLSNPFYGRFCSMSGRVQCVVETWLV